MAEYRSPQTEPGNEQRFLLVILMMAAVIFGAQFLLRKNAPAPPSNSGKPSQEQTTSAPVTPSGPSSALSAAQTPIASAKAPKQSATTKQASSETETVVENDLYRVILTNRGAQVKSWLLKNYKDDQGKPLDLVNQTAAAKFGYPLSLWTYDEGQRNKVNSALYVGSANGALRAPTKLDFEYSDSGL